MKQKEMLNMKWAAVAITIMSLLVAAAVSNNARAADTISQNSVQAEKVKLAENILNGPNMPSLDFADDERVIFHSYYGVFVYDLTAQKLKCSLDLENLNFSSNNLEVQVNQSGSQVYIFSNNRDNVYRWNIEQNTIVKQISITKNKLFSKYIDNIEIEKKKGPLNYSSFLYSESAIYFSENDYGQLYVPTMYLKDIKYIRGKREWEIFKSENMTTALSRQTDGYYDAFRHKADKSKQDFYECYSTLLSRSDYTGLWWLSKDKKYIEEKQAELAQYDLITAGEEIQSSNTKCCFKIYITVSNWKEMNLDKENYVSYLYIAKDENDHWYANRITSIGE